MNIFRVLNSVVDALSGDSNDSQSASSKKQCAQKPLSKLDAAKQESINSAKKFVYDQCYSKIVKELPEVYARNRNSYVVYCDCPDTIQRDSELIYNTMEKASVDAFKAIGLENYKVSRSTILYKCSLEITWE